MGVTFEPTLERLDARDLVGVAGRICEVIVENSDPLSDFPRLIPRDDSIAQKKIFSRSVDWNL